MNSSEICLFIYGEGVLAKALHCLLKASTPTFDVTLCQSHQEILSCIGRAACNGYDYDHTDVFWLPHHRNFSIARLFALNRELRDAGLSQPDNSFLGWSGQLIVQTHNNAEWHAVRSTPPFDQCGGVRALRPPLSFLEVRSALACREVLYRDHWNLTWNSMSVLDQFQSGITDAEDLLCDSEVADANLSLNTAITSVATSPVIERLLSHKSFRALQAMDLAKKPLSTDEQWVKSRLADAKSLMKPLLPRT